MSNINYYYFKSHAELQQRTLRILYMIKGTVSAINFETLHQTLDNNK